MSDLDLNFTVKALASWIRKDVSHGWLMEDSIRDHIATIEYLLRKELDLD